jgi:hypothetical protein
MELEAAAGKEVLAASRIDCARTFGDGDSPTPLCDLAGARERLLTVPHPAGADQSQPRVRGN